MSPRSQAYAKVKIEAANVLGYLRDLSREGCQVALLDTIELDADASLTVRIIAPPEIGLKTFSVAFQVMWSRSSPPYFLMGGTYLPLGGKAEQAALEELLRYYTD
jgi:hypothetical protein